VYAQFYGILIPLAHGLSLLALRRGQIPLKRVVWSTRYLAYALVPIAVFLLKMGAGNMLWLPRVNLAVAHHFLSSIAGNGGHALLIVASTAALMGLAAALRAWLVSGRGFETWRYALVVFWSAFPVATVMLAGMFRPFFLARYLIVSLPAWILLVSLGICRLRYSAMCLAVLAIIGMLAVGGVSSYYRADFDLVREDWRATSRYILANARPGDAAFFYVAPGRLPFEYYRSLAGAPMSVPEVVYPASADHLTYRDFLVVAMAEVLPNLPERGERMWLVLSSAPDMINDVMRVWYGKRYPFSREVDVGGIRVVIYSRRIE
jgi:hypothetical protein